MDLAVLHSATTRTPSSHVQLAAHPSGLVVTADEKEHNQAVLWRLDTLACPRCFARQHQDAAPPQPAPATERVATLTGHDRKLTAAAFSNGSPCRLLCTASEDAVLLWGLSDGACARLLDDPPDTPYYIVFSPTNQFLALCIGDLIYVATPADSTVACVLEGHAGAVTCAAFGLAFPSFLVTADDDRRFKVWDVARNSLLFQSQYESPTPFTAAAFDSEGRRCFLGASDGSLHVFQLEPSGVCRRIATVDCKRLASKLLTAAATAAVVPPPLQAAHATHAGSSSTGGANTGSTTSAGIAATTAPQQRGVAREVSMDQAVGHFGVSAAQSSGPTVVSSKEAWRRRRLSGGCGDTGGGGGLGSGEAGGTEDEQGLSHDLLDADMTIVAIGRLHFDTTGGAGTGGSGEGGGMQGAHGLLGGKRSERARQQAALQDYLKMVGGHSPAVDDSSVLSVLQRQQTLMSVATSQGLILLNCHTLKGVGVYRWARRDDWSMASSASPLPASVASCFLTTGRVLCRVCDTDMALAAVAGAFQRAVHILSLCRHTEGLGARGTGRKEGADQMKKKREADGRGATSGDLPATRNVTPDLALLSLNPEQAVPAHPGHDRAGSGGEDAAVAALSVLATAPLERRSPLHAVLQPKPPKKTKSSAGRRSSRMPGTRKLPSGRRAQSADQAVTFRTKIKSSGYTAAPRRSMFTPNTLKPLKARSSLRTSRRPGSRDLLNRQPLGGVAGRRDPASYPLHTDPPSVLAETKALTKTTQVCGILGLELNSNGSSACAWLSDRTVHTLPSRLSSSKASCVGLAHDASISRASWSLDGKWLLSSGADEHVVVWNAEKMEAVLCMSQLRHNFKPKPEDTTPNPEMTRLRQAQFYYMDRFILSCHGADICLYKYHLDPTVDDLRRYANKSKYKLVTALSNDNAHGLTCLSAVNSFHSHLVLAGASDRSVSIFDMNRSSLVRSIPRVHSRAVYQITQNSGSPLVSHPAEAYNLFLTGALSDGLALWDVRAKESIRKFTQHTCRAVPVGFQFSPCGRFIVCGSEDKSAYVYDIRQGLLLHKLGPHLDVVTDVAHHPQHPLVITASMDGRLRSFAPA